MEIRELNLKDPWVKTFGTIDGGLELMNAAWPTMRQVFAVRREKMPALEKLHEDQGTSPPLLYGARYPLNLLSRNPVDLLTVDKGCVTQPPHGYELTRWEDLLNHTDQESRPKVVVEIWASNAQTWEKGPAGKACRERWRERGYSSRFRRVDATQVGCAIQQVRFLAVRVQEDWASYWQWPDFEKDSFQVRSMSNLLTPPGLVSVRDYRTPAGPCYLPDARTDPMPNRPKAWIKTERGTRRLHADETARGLGLPKEWNWGLAALDPGLLSQTTSLFLWEYLSETLSNDVPNEPPAPPRPFRRPRVRRLLLLRLFSLFPGYHQICYLVAPGIASAWRTFGALRPSIPTRPPWSRTEFGSWRPIAVTTTRRDLIPSSCSFCGGSFPRSTGMVFAKEAR